LLPGLALEWVDQIYADPEYEQITKARDSLVHSRLPRHFMLSMGAGPRERLKLDIEGIQVSIRTLIELSRNVGTKHVSAFFDLLPKI
jgi:hypothetical protein